MMPTLFKRGKLTRLANYARMFREPVPIADHWNGNWQDYHALLTWEVTTMAMSKSASKRTLAKSCGCDTYFDANA